MEMPVLNKRNGFTPTFANEGGFAAESKGIFRLFGTFKSKARMNCHKTIVVSVCLVLMHIYTCKY